VLRDDARIRVAISSDFSINPKDPFQVSKVLPVF
jgi:hypothetical protein